LGKYAMKLKNFIFGADLYHCPKPESIS